MTPGNALASAPLLADLMPWGVPPLRLGRSWVMAPDDASLVRRWDALLRAEGAARDALFHPSRGRSLRRAVAQLPGQPSGTGQLGREERPCPPPVRVLHGAFDQQWLIPDHRLIDAARPELWRVADGRQLFAVEVAHAGDGDGPAVVGSALLPDGRSPAGRPGRIRPLYRRPGGREPNLAPGLTRHLGERLGHPVAAEDVLAWVLAAARPAGRGCAVPLTADPDAWAEGVELGRSRLALQLRGARGGSKPRLPGGRRPYVRAALPARPGEPVYEEDEDGGDGTLLLGEGRVSPVARAAWDFTAGGVRVLEQWIERRTAPAEPGTLDALRPAAWPQQWTSELLDLITTLTLLAELPPPPAFERRVTAYELRGAGVLPAPAAARRPASVLDHHEEGPEGQFALI